MQELKKDEFLVVKPHQTANELLNDYEY